MINQEQNDWVNFLKELIELVFSPSNHLIGINLKLDGNTLHILVLGMDSHLLFELTYVLYRVCSAIILGEHWLVEFSRKFCLFYPLCKGRFRNLA